MEEPRAALGKSNWVATIGQRWFKYQSQSEMINSAVKYPPLQLDHVIYSQWSSLLECEVRAQNHLATIEASGADFEGFEA